MTETTPMRVDHVGIAVASIENAEPVLRAFGAEKLLEEFSEGFTWAYYRLGNGSRFELIEPTDEDSFLTDFLDQHGPGLHHVTLEVADIDRATEGVEAAGLRVVDRADEDDWREAFVSPRNPTGTLFQLMEYREGFAATREFGSELFVGGRPLDGEPE
ncbi:glyoxalase [Halobacteriales archaeon QS_8_65_32]|nr:MAG: glyoxalase [Halobacteriales archaeon QS_8_65_32]